MGCFDCPPERFGRQGDTANEKLNRKGAADSGFAGEKREIRYRGPFFARSAFYVRLFGSFFEAPGFSVGMSAKTGRLTGADRRTAALAAFCRKGETVSGCFRKSFQYSLHIRRKTPAFCCSSSIKIFSEKNEKSSLSKSYQKRRKTAKTRETHIDNRKMRKSLLTSPPPCANIIEC